MKKIMKAKLVKEEMTPADRGMEAARYDNIHPAEVLNQSFENAATALDQLNEIPAFNMSDDIKQSVESALSGVEKLMDVIDEELRASGYDRHA